ncbi:hypothetical protein A9Q84_21470 [Halobacteriovorax marinus]|uniref:UvrABC system protein A n=1 Tax=Halobacteriovorax marinus TaxID=97084 RepID=A0A1Y5F2B7_9BACT|nr:hypothetical protein A9Q84_21470 [Halobacteriovorax marinus]
MGLFILNSTMSNQNIVIKGARTHNLKNLDLKIRLNSITCICGPSGSGKSSLAFHTILTESKRRFMNSFPSDVKFFWDIPQSADVDEITPVLPVWGLAQSNPVVGSRPCAVDLMGVNERLSKILYSLGKNYCPVHKEPLEVKLSLDEMLEFINKQKIDSKDVVHLFLDRDDYSSIYGDTFFPSRSYEEGVCDFDDSHRYWELLKFRYSKIGKLENRLKELRLNSTSGSLLIYIPAVDSKCVIRISKERKCSKCEKVEKIKISSPLVFSPFSPLGACDNCSGHGLNLEYDREKIVKNDRLSLKEGAVNFLTYSHFKHIFPDMIREAKKAGFDTNVPFHKLSKKVWTFLENGSGSYCGLLVMYDYLETKKYKKNIRILIRSLKSEVICESCDSTRLSRDLLSFRIPQLKRFDLETILKFNFNQLFEFVIELEKVKDKIVNWKDVSRMISALKGILKVSLDLGLGHLSLLSKVKALSINNYQKIILVKYLSFEGSGSLFILDESSLGLDLSEQKVLLKYLRKLKSSFNTIVLVDHSDFLQRNSDEIILMGPGAGPDGGKITYQGKYKSQSLSKPKKRIEKNLEEFSIAKITTQNFSLENINVAINGLNIVRGKSYSSKKEIYIEGLANIVSEVLGLDKISKSEVDFKRPKKLPNFSKVLVLNSKFNKFSSRSSVGTMIGLTPYIRKYYANLPVSKNLGLKDGHFSSNSELGKCISCEGKGLVSVDMQFLEDIQFVCDDCKGMKLKPFIATITDGNFSIYETLSKPMSEVIPNLSTSSYGRGLTPKGKRIWEYLKLLNLDYLSLDRSLSSLSGGEKQRLKLLSELQKNIENSLIIFEDLSFGLSHREIYKIGEFLDSLIKKGNTIVLVDENEHFSSYADRIINV